MALGFNPNMTADEAYRYGNPAGRSITGSPLPLLGDAGGMGMGLGTARPGAWDGFAQPPTGGFFDPATGQLIRTPTTPEELAEAEREGRNLALSGQASATESAINKGTEEISESEREAQRVAGQAGAAAGVTNPADMQRGQQRIMSQYSGQRANLARDVRMRQADQQRAEDSSMFGRMFAYSQAGERAKELEQDRLDSGPFSMTRRMMSGRAGGGGPRGAGGIPPFGGGGLGGKSKNAREYADVANRTAWTGKAPMPTAVEKYGSGIQW